MSSVDRIVTATLPPEPGRGSVVLVGDMAVQHLDRGPGMYDGPGERHWFPVLPGGNSTKGAFNWVDLLGMSTVRVIWDVDLDAQEDNQ